MSIMDDNIQFDSEFLIRTANAKMPFGKYKDRFLMDLPIAYLEWFSLKGFPKGELGNQLTTVYDIKLNGLDKLLTPLRKKQ